jgi:hypothetical protein
VEVARRDVGAFDVAVRRRGREAILIRALVERPQECGQRELL